MCGCTVLSNDIGGLHNTSLGNYFAHGYNDSANEWSNISDIRDCGTNCKRYMGVQRGRKGGNAP